VVPVEMPAQHLAHQMLANGPSHGSEGQRAKYGAHDHGFFGVRPGVVKRIFKKVGTQNRKRNEQN